MTRKYQAVLFDLLTALLDSWTVWDETAGSRDMGRKWRAAYLALTYGCGAYRPYEMLVSEAAEQVGLDRRYADALEANWPRLAPWPGVADALAIVSDRKLGIVTNCSERLGRMAASQVPARFDVIVTSERAGHYKPDARPYRLALDELGLPAERVLFVSGSGYDLFGTAQVGLDTYWHNRIGIAAPPGAPSPLIERPTLAELAEVALREG